MNAVPPALATAAHEPAYHPGSGWRPRYWSIFGGQALSLVGSALTQFVLLWWIADTTASVAALAFAGVAALLPQALLSPLGGTCADRYNRRLLMIAADAVSAACMLVLIGLFATNRIELWHVYSMMCIRSSAQAFQAPALGASTSMLVPHTFVPRAAALYQSLQGATLVAAAPLGALAIGTMPLGWALGIDVATALAGIAPLLAYKIPQKRGPVPAGGAGLWLEFREGVALIWHDPGLRRLYALLAAVVLVIMPCFTMLPLLVKTHFSGGAGDVALMEACAGAGMIAAGIAVAAIAPRAPVRWILWGFALSCAALALTALAPARLFGVAVTWWMLSGFLFILGDAPMTGLLQTTIPNHLQGRALSLLAMVMGLAAPVGLALATPLGELVGVRWLFVILGVSGCAVSLAGFLSPALLRLGRPQPTQVQARGRSQRQ